jgi:hypothetical protein
MSIRIKSFVGILAAVTIASVTSAPAQTPASDTVRIGYQKSSTLTAILKNQWHVGEGASAARRPGLLA